MIKRKLKIGVTIFVREGAQSLWENGIFQNCYFLLMLLNLSPLIEQAYLVNGGVVRTADDNHFLSNFPAPVIDLEAALDCLDVVIELSAQLDRQWAVAFRERGGHIIGMKVANDYMIDVERTAFGLPSGMLVSGVPYDVVWTLPAFLESCESYYRATLNAQVRPMQHLWSPVLLEQAIIHDDRAVQFEYGPGRKKWRIAVLEPNICSVKNCLVPLLIVDLMHRRDPNAIEYLRVFNSLQFKTNSTFMSFVSGLNVVQHGIASFESRFPVYQIMPDFADAVVSHQWMNGQNYIYYEAIWGGFPLIHNSDFLGDCGYRYDGLDCEGGARTLHHALLVHDLEINSYRERGKTLLRQLDPTSPKNVMAYSDAIVAAIQ